MAKMRSESRPHPGGSLRAAVRPNSLDEQERTVDVVFATETPVPRYGYVGRFQEILSIKSEHMRLGRIQSGNAPVLDSHSRWDTKSVIGVVERAWIEGNEAIGRLRFDDGAEGEEVFRKIRSKILRNVSVGYSVYRYEEMATGEGEDLQFRAVDWEPNEVSVVPIGADENSVIRSRSDEDPICEFILLGDRAMAKLKEDKADGHAAAIVPDVADSKRAADAAVAADRARSKEIAEVSARFGVGADFYQRFVDDGSSADTYRSALLDHLEEKDRKSKPAPSPAPDIVGGTTEGEKRQQAASDWLMIRSMQAGNYEAHRSKELGRPYRCDPGEFRGMSLLDMARYCLESNGVSARGLTKMELVAKAFTQKSGLWTRAPGYNATGDFPVLLENLLHKTLLSAYAVTPDTWSRICKVGSVSDFRAHPRYRVGTFGSLSVVPEGTEYKYIDQPDGEKETISAETRGALLAVTRQMIVNDDMDAFTTRAAGLGRAARLSIEKKFYEVISENAGLGPLMNDGNTLYHPNHGNVGTDSVFGTDEIDADLVLLAKQTDPSGNEILDLRPAILLVAIELETTARKYNGAEYDPDAAITGVPNVIQGKFRDIVGTARLTGKRRYIFTDPAVLPVFEVVFLEGQREPFLDSKESWEVDGNELKVRHDFGVGALDFRGTVTNDGVP